MKHTGWFPHTGAFPSPFTRRHWATKLGAIVASSSFVHFWICAFLECGTKHSNENRTNFWVSTNPGKVVIWEQKEYNSCEWKLGRNLLTFALQTGEGRSGWGWGASANHQVQRLFEACWTCHPAIYRLWCKRHEAVLRDSLGSGSDSRMYRKCWKCNPNTAQRLQHTRLTRLLWFIAGVSEGNVHKERPFKEKWLSSPTFLLFALFVTWSSS